MNIPKNCLECQHKEYCRAPHYGGCRCKYEKEIRTVVLNNMKD